MLKVKRQLPRSQWDLHAEIVESNANAVEKERIPHQDEYEKHEQQQGTMLHSNEVVRRVLNMNPKLWVEDSRNLKGHANFYYTGHDGTKRCAGAPFKKGPMREFSVLYVDRAGRIASIGPGSVPVEYGWRTVLQRLLSKQLITWAQIVMNFRIHVQAQSGPFDQQTQVYKN
jgi:hypothetical protein